MAKQADKIQIIAISLIITLVAVTGLVLYQNNQLAQLNEELTVKLQELNVGILSQLNALQTDLDEELQSVKTNLTSELDLVDTSLANFRKKNEQDIAAINSLIDEIEQQSDIELNKLKDEISSIQVESSDFSAIIDDVIKSVVSVGTDRGQGSGAVIDDRGFIVTNYHVVEDASLIRVLTFDSKVYDATLIGFNEELDIAVLQVDTEDTLEDLRFGDSDDMQVGAKVIALGNPAGLSFSVTEGIVSATKRKGANNLDIYIQTDVSINPGNSGGPLVDTSSRIIGINNFKIGGFEGLGFAIESNVVEEIAEDIIDQYLEQ